MSFAHQAELNDSSTLIDVGQPLHCDLVGEIEAHASETLVQDRDLAVDCLSDRALQRLRDLLLAKRIERPRPSIESVREVVANAVAHRDYGVTRPVQIRVFTDRLEVVSRGGLPNGVTPEAMRVGVSVHRNPFLVEFVRVRHIIDAYGRGVVLLIEEAARLELPQPSIKAPDGFVEVVVFWDT